MRIIDPWMNADMPEWGEEPWMLAVAERYLGPGQAGLRRLEAAELLEAMDANGVERAILDLNLDRPSAHTLAVVEAAPERFASASGTTCLGRWRHRRSRAWGRTHGKQVLEVPVPSGWFQARPDAARLPRNSDSRRWDPIHLDRVCFDFPELTVVMAHRADPWWELAIRLMIKWPRLHLQTSAYRPRYLPAALLHYMRTRGPEKVIFSSDHPLLEIEKCAAGNAERVFFA